MGAPGTLRDRMNAARKLRSPRRERELAALEKERQELILSVHDWVWDCVNTFFHRYRLGRQDRDDLAQEAFKRVVMGAETYDPAKGAPSTYFGWVAWDGMRKWMDVRGFIHVPRTSAKAGSASVREHAERVKNASLLSLDYDYEDSDQGPIVATSEDTRPFEFDEIERLRAAMKHLPTRDRQILLDRMHGRSLHEIGADHGISKERVRQIQILALDKLRQRLLPDARREAARKGARALHTQGKAHRFSSEQAAAAGAKGGKARKVRQQSA